MASSRTKNYLAGLFTGYTVTFVTVTVGLWLTPFVLRFLDREEYAIFALSTDILMWLNLLDFGIIGALRVQAAQVTGCPDQEKINRLTSTAFFTQLGVVLLVCLAGTVVVYTFPSFFHVRADLQTPAMQVVALLALGSVLSMGTQTFSALLVAHQQIHIDNLIRLALIAIRTVLTVVLLLAGWKLLSLALASVAATGITSVLAIIRAYYTVPGLTISFRLASWNMLGSLGHLGIWFSLGVLAGIAIENLDRALAARFISLETVTTLHLTGRVYILAGSLLAQITNTARPALGQLLGQGKKTEALRTYRHLFALSSGGALVAAFALWAGNGYFVPWWVGSVNYGGGWLDLALAANLIVHAWVLPNRATLASALIVRPQTLCRLAEGALHVLLAIILVRYLGLVGIVVSTAIAGVITSCWYLPRLTAKLFNRPFLRFWWDDTARLLMVGALLPVVALGARWLGLHVQGILGAALSSSLTLLIGGILLMVIGFDNSLRALIFEKCSMPYRMLSEKIVSFRQAT